MANLNVNNIIENALGGAIAFVLISIIGLIFRQKISNFFKNSWERIYGFYIARCKRLKFYLIKRGNPIYLISKEGQKRHIPEWETYELLGDVLGFKTSDCKVVTKQTANTIETGEPIPSLIKIEEIFSDTFNNKRAKILLKFIYRKLLKRGPDPEGETAYVPILEKEGFNGLVKVVETIKNSPEYKQIR